jgi:Class II histone deacetylase complex subunits 2 and 3
MDSSFKADLPDIVKLRSNIIEVGKIAPVFRLVALNTIEHIRLCCSATVEKHLDTYIETIKNLRLDAGVANDSYAPIVAEAPSKIAKWLTKGSGEPLDLESLPELPLFDQATQSSELYEGGDKRKRQVFALMTFHFEQPNWITLGRD